MRVALGDRDSAIERWLGLQNLHLDHKTIGRVRADLARIPDRLLKSLPDEIQDYVTETYGGRVAPANPYQRLTERYWVPPEITQLMDEARAEGPRSELSVGYQERQKKWEEEWQKLNRACREQDWPWEATLIHISSYLIFGARTQDNFPTKILHLFDRHNFRNIDESARFMYELDELLRLNK